MNQKIKNAGVLITVIAGMMLQIVYYSSSLVYNNRLIFFLVLLVVVFPTLYTIFFYPNQKHLIFFLLALTSLFVNMMYIFYSKDLPYIPSYDSLFHYKVTDAILRTHHTETLGSIFDPDPLFIYSNYPGFHLILAILAMVPSIDCILVVKISPLIYIIMPFLIYLLSKCVFHSKSIAYLAAYLYIFIPQWIPFPSYNTLVIVFLIMLLLSLFQFQATRRRQYYILALISMFSASFTHHETTYIILGLIFFAYVFHHAIPLLPTILGLSKEGGREGIVITSLMSYFILGMLWTAQITYSVFNLHVNSFIRWFILRIPYADEYLRSVMVYYGPAERVFIITSVLSVCILGLIGFIGYLRRDGCNINFVGITLYFGFIALLLMLSTNINPTVQNLSTRSLRFLFVCLAPLLGFATFEMILNRLKKKKGTYMKIAIIVLLMSFTVSVVDLMPWGFFYFSSEEQTGWLAGEVRQSSESMYNSILWYANFAPQLSKAVGDVPIHQKGAGMLDLSILYYIELYKDPTIIAQHITYLRERNVNYIFIDYLMSIYKEQPTAYVFEEPIPISNLNFLANNCTCFSTVYDNRIIKILYTSN